MAQVDQQIAALQAEIIRMNGELTAQAAAVAQAQAGAAAAAQVQGARAAQTATAQAFSPLIDTRMLTKPRSFNGKEEDWSQFATVTRAYCGALDPRLYNEMEEAAQQTVPVLNANLPDPAKQHRSQTIYYLLVMLVEGRAMSMAENCKCGEGFELWRKLTETYEPKAGTRAAGLLVRILTVDFDMQDFLSSLEKWEYLIKQYDHMVGGIDDLQDRVKIATLVSRMGKGVVQDHFLVNVSKYTKYEDLRKKWSTSCQPRSTSAAQAEIRSRTADRHRWRSGRWSTASGRKAAKAVAPKARGKARTSLATTAGSQAT